MEDPLWWAAEFEWRGFFHSSCWNWTCVGICGIQGSSYLWYREQCLVDLLSAYLKSMAWWGGEWGAHWGGKLSVPLSGQFHMFMLCLGYVWGIWLRCPFLPKSRRQTITSYLETFVLHSQLLGIVVGDCNTHCQDVILCSSQAVVWIYIQLSWDPNLQGYFWIVLNLEKNLDPHKNKTVKQDRFIFVSLCVI